MNTSWTSPLNTFPHTDGSVCASPTNSVDKPLEENLVCWSIISELSGLMHIAMLPTEPDNDRDD